MNDSASPPGRHDPEAGRGPIGTPRSTGLTILVTIVTLGIWTWVWSYLNGEELRTYRGEGIGGVGFLLLTIFIAPVTMFLMANEVERMYRDAGEHPRITTLWGLWFLLPLIGQIIWYVRIQGAINTFWQERGGSTSPGLA
jgi:4-amino-4-deoxy-L-arabinose transferase-like glycosyltransferase